MIKSFKPIVDKNSKILILGSMPGAESLEKQQYYAYSRNHFWKILFTVFNEEFQQDYEKRKELLIRNNVALWDVIETCDRVSSSDSKIKNAKANDFQWFFNEYPQINKIYFNGKSAESFFIKLVINNFTWKELELFSLPSTSPANTKSFQYKLNVWKKITDN